jgi:hypothetical protein
MFPNTFVIHLNIWYDIYHWFLWGNLKLM